MIRSLRLRIILASALWSLGLLGIAHGLSVTMLHKIPALRLRSVQHGMFLGMLACSIMLVGLLWVWHGLKPIDRLRTRLTGLREGVDRRIEGRYPSEIQPLIDELNALLAHREEVVRRAIAKAGDLAHGLKTPLAVLSHEAERAEDAGHAELAASIAHEVERMRRQVDYHLAHARAAASGTASGARASVRESAEGLSRTLLKLRGIAIDVDVPEEHVVRVQREDLDEMLGNLLDNACKYARSRVRVTTTQSEATIVIAVHDDGPGIAPEMRKAVLQRGVRADEAAPGSGLGLAIVRDLAELYGGSITLGASPDGGARARLELPRAV